MSSIPIFNQTVNVIVQLYSQTTPMNILIDYGDGKKEVLSADSGTFY